MAEYSFCFAHDRCSDDITEAMRLRGGYVCHLDATCEGRYPILMSSLDSISQIVLGNIKLPAEDEKHIVPFLQRMKKNYDIPIALVNNLQNPEYMKILLKEKTSLEELFAEIEIDTLRDELRKAQFSPEKIPIKIKRLTAMPDYPEKLMKMVEKALALS